MDYRKQAYHLKSIGVNVCPLKINGSKLPSIYWKELQDRMITDKEIEEHCKDCGGLAGLTGKISQLICFDFDLDKQLLSQDYWKRFMAEVPDELKRKMLINTTRSGGFHIWARTDYEDKSRKVAHRALTIHELKQKYDEAVADGADPYKVSKALLRKPKQCIIETRSRGSYGVISHESYNRFYGTEINWFTQEEIEFLLTIGYSLDFTFRPQKKYTGDVEDYRLIIRYNEDTTAEEVLEMMESTGLYTYAGANYNGDIQLKRSGSNNKYSSVIFLNSGLVHDFGMSNLFSDDKESHTPFEVFCAVNDLTEDEGLEKLTEKYKK